MTNLHQPAEPVALNQCSDHIHEAVRASAEFHAEHERRATPLMLLLNAITTFLGHRYAIVIFSAATVIWVVVNMMLPRVGLPAFDAPPFPILDFILAYLAVATTLVILSSQQHESQVADSRAKITLELAIIGEQKSAKIIEMLDNLRRDMPDVHTTEDPAVTAFASSSAPQTMLNDLEESRRNINNTIVDENR